MQVTVRSGDSFWRYSVLFGIPFQLIIDSNPGTDPNALVIGQSVQIPGFVWSNYTIQRGDSLWRIAVQNGISTELLLQTNPGLAANALQIGQVIRVPIRITGPIIQPQREYTYAALREDLATLQSVYPFLRRSSIGRSVMGKEIPEVQIGIGPKSIHFNAAIHANEWITTPVLMRFMNEYALALTNSADIRGVPMYPQYLQTSLSIVPMLNPDGVNLVISGPPAEEPYGMNALAINGGSGDFSGWKANIRGVDLNKQFPALWERDAVIGPQEPSPRDYSGAAPLTEPEVQHLAALTRERDFDRVLAFHTQGEVFYWGFEGLEPPESEVLASEFARVSGYSSERFIESTAGYKDWFIQDWRRPGFTIELGLGQNPLPLSQFGRMYDAALGIMLAALYM
ncbi:LysM peptidoglycan-binding domain-containing protein [Paenibacillus nanensis]|uniref:LysM peptidoglycan-binding domain-containing protein n=1 Tax=Paenibacillus nanensis TaxID=393251 RepID=A0A3A1UYE3_9BACL|nr:M14 family metallopeptidase [Paenibacillus nanensis]RIX53557.1 LysM peptidoglycan-binding domain-containing protein [Paenibacillus nanensis]